MKHSLYLLITSIGCGIILSSCQSRVKNSSFYNDTDTVNTVMESVDSTSIIEEQKRIAAEEARLQERKAELDKLSKNFNQKKDEFSNKTWIFPKNKPKYRNRNATYCYFMKQSNEVSLISAALYFNVFYKYLSNKKLLRILPCQKFHLS